MEGHKWQAISSQFAFAFCITFKGQECMGSFPSKSKATFQLLLHNFSFVDLCSKCEAMLHIEFKNELPL